MISKKAIGIMLTVLMAFSVFTIIASTAAPSELTTTTGTQRPTVTIYTDKTTYTTGDTMYLGLYVTNPGEALVVTAKIGVEKPDGSTAWLIKKPFVRLPAGLDYSTPTFKVFTLPSIPAGTYTWHAVLSNPVTGLIICEDTSEWTFVRREEIKIGIVAPLTGGASTTGNDMWQSAILAADEINAAGGVNINGFNMQITLVKGDTETSREGGVEVVTKLITEDEVDLLVGGFSSGITLADQVVASEHKVPFIITGASAPSVTRRTDIDTSYFFHHCPTTDDFPESTLLFVDAVVRPKIYERFNFAEGRPLRLAVLYQDSAYGEGVYDGIKKTIENYNLNMEIVAVEKFEMDETDFRTPLTVIKAAKPDVVYPAAFVHEQPLIVAQGMSDVGLNTIYLSVECNDDPDYYTGVGRWGVYSIQESRFSPYAIPSGSIHDAVVKFKEDYERKWGASPGMMGASTYEGVYIAAEAIENAGTVNKEKIRDSLAEIAMPQMVEMMKDGVITFSQDYRESKFELYMQQLIWNETAGETRPKIVWPESVKETDFVLPDWYEPGGT